MASRERAALAASSRSTRNRRVDAGARKLRLVLAQLPARMEQAIRLFHDLTGLTAVTSLRLTVGPGGGPDSITPPIHPLCASLIRGRKLDTPCEEQWRWHLRTALSARAAHDHVCPMGLRCFCVPIFYGENLVGAAKLVAGPRTTDRRFSLAVQVLELTVSRLCQDLYISSLTAEMDGLRRQVADLQQVRGRARSDPEIGGKPAEARTGQPLVGRAAALVDQTLGYVAANYLDPALSLAGVSRAMGVNGKYITRLFTRVVGQHMHAYILGLRAQHACRLLVSTEKQIKQIAYESGFRRPDRFRRAFREHVGVAPASYRRIFTSA